MYEYLRGRKIETCRGEITEKGENQVRDKQMKRTRG